MLDRCGRNIDYLRISITDKCNLRCVYCMPEDGVRVLAHEELLSFEEIERVTRALAKRGVRYLRLTGGEPMARRGCLDLVRMLAAVPGIEEIAMTTNGILLAGRVREARDAGLTAVNVSLDALDPGDFARITRGGDVTKALQTIDEAIACGVRVKVNAVPARGLNERGLTALAALAKDRPIDVRFIELMPVGLGDTLEPIPSDEIEALLTEAFGPLTPDPSRHGWGPAKYVKPAGFTGSIGLIAAMTHEFCDQCNRVRLTADGRLKLCLNHADGLDVRALLRGGVSDDALGEALTAAIERKPRRHGFGESVPDREARRMNQIGG